ncbi:MAG: glycosyltransferase family 2 protein [Alphaproteobacteria bacterium]
MSPTVPKVSVVIATYNWSSVLRFAIRSVLAQTMADFELIVVGDGCTDDSESVIRGFDDMRVRWHNLPANSGNQSAPNNKGIELARGTYIAYLGHDDLWHPRHLEHLVHACETLQADAAHSLQVMIEPPPSSRRILMGLAPHGFVAALAVPPSALLHRRDVVARSGPWRDYRTILMPPDLDFLGRIWDAGCKIMSVAELTSFKFPSAWRRNSYVEKPYREQEAYLARLQSEPDLQYRELLAGFMDLARHTRDMARRGGIATDTMPGSITEGYRALRGLAPKDAPLKGKAPTTHGNRDLLKYLNIARDIVPEIDTEKLLRERTIRPDGLFVGLRWHDLEIGSDGTRWRWATNDAEIFIADATGTKRVLRLDLMPGPGTNYRPVPIDIFDRHQRLIGHLDVDKPAIYRVEIPFGSGVDETLRLHTDAGGQRIDGDPRIMNFGARAICWE